MNTLPCVFFVGAGPGDPELLTIKAKKCIEQAGLVLFAGSLVPAEIIAFAAKDAELVDSAPLHLEETHALICRTIAQGKNVARVHTGDPSLYGTIREQMTLLDKENIPYMTIPGITASFAMAASCNRSFTVPAQTQTLIITRVDGRTPVPKAESLRKLASHGASMAVYLSAGHAKMLQKELLAGGMKPDTLIGIGYRVGWADQEIVECSLENLAQTVHEKGFVRQTVFLVLPDENTGQARSLLYDKNFAHMFRQKAGQA